MILIIFLKGLSNREIENVISSLWFQHLLLWTCHMGKLCCWRKIRGHQPIQRVQLTSSKPSLLFRHHHFLSKRQEIHMTVQMKWKRNYNPVPGPTLYYCYLIFIQCYKEYTYIIKWNVFIWKRSNILKKHVKCWWTAWYNWLLVGKGSYSPLHILSK